MIAGCSGTPEKILINAAAKGDIYAVKDALKDSKAKIDDQVDIRGTALHISAEKGHTKVFGFLVSKGADINAKVEMGSQDPVIVTAAQWDRYDIIKILIDEKVKINETGTNGSTALDFAKIKKNQKIIDLLTKNGGISKNP